MKVKLLKKVRKRFEITHMPNGFTENGERYEYNLYKLTDSTNLWYERFAQLGKKPEGPQFSTIGFIFETQSECVYCLKKFILNKLRSEGHLGRKDNYMKKQHKKVWYK